MYILRCGFFHLITFSHVPVWAQKRSAHTWWLSKTAMAASLECQLNVDNIDYALTGVACSLYVVSTYLEDETAMDTTLGLAEVAVSAGLFAIYIGRLWTARHPLEFALTPTAVVDLLTSAPVLFALLFLSHEVFNHMRILRVLRVLRTFGIAAELSLQPVARQALVVGLTLFSVIYISTCSFPLLENFDNPHERTPLCTWPRAAECGHMPPRTAACCYGHCKRSGLVDVPSRQAAITYQAWPLLSSYFFAHFFAHLFSHTYSHSSHLPHSRSHAVGRLRLRGVQISHCTTRYTL